MSKPVVKNLYWLLLSLVIFVLDQASKYFAHLYLSPFNSQKILPFLNLVLGQNEGAAFNFLAQASGWQRWFFILIGILVCVFLIRWLMYLPAKSVWASMGISLVVGGALGNIWDRLFYGKVTDFIDVYYHQWHWPAFNVADSAITVGAIMIVIYLFWEDDKKQSK